MRLARSRRFRSATGLERAREQKLEWTQSTTWVLSKVFGERLGDRGNTTPGEGKEFCCEFADLDRFIEHFYDEMDQRIGKLQAIHQESRDRAGMLSAVRIFHTQMHNPTVPRTP